VRFSKLEPDRIYSLEEEPDPELDSWYHLYVAPEPI
jgi:hypothetical protein